MKGIIFNLFEDFITDNFGEEKLDEIISKCSLKTNEPFVGPGTYPDEDLLEILAKTVEELDLKTSDALHSFGRYSMLKLAKKFPEFVNPHKHPRDFIKTIDDFHQMEVRKLYSDAEPPKFSFKEISSKELLFTYTSKRKLCKLITGLLEGVAEYYNSPIKVTQNSCLNEGASGCEFKLEF